MFRKSITIISLVLVGLLAVSAVSANELNATDSITADIDDAVIEVSSDDIAGDADDGTFAALKNKIDEADENSVIELENDYSFNSTEPITISKSLTINGNGYTIDCNSQSEAFLLTGTVTLRNIVFENCQGQYGGAVSVWGANCDIDTCKFINCSGKTAYGVPSNDNRGGAIYNLGANCKIDTCEFINCTTYNGGAVYCSAQNSKIYSCKFTNCYAENQGGAVSTDMECVMDNCIFTNCTSPNKGGAVFNAGDVCNIDYCTFTACRAFTGNAIHTQKGTTKATGCKFTDLTKGEVGTVTEMVDCIFMGSEMAEILELSAMSHYYGMNTTIDVKTNVAGKIIVKINETVKEFDIEADTLTTFDLGIMDAGFKEINVTLDAGENYNKPTDTVGVYISPVDTSVKLEVSNGNYGENYIVRLLASHDGTVTVEIGDKTQGVNVTAHKTTSANMGLFDIATYEVTATFNGDINHVESSDQKTVKISQGVPQLTIMQIGNYVYGDNVTVHVQTSIDGNATLKMDEITKTIPVKADQLNTINFGILDSGFHYLDASLDAGANYIQAKATSTIRVYLKDTSISLEAKDCIEGNNVMVYITASETGNVTVKLGDAVKTVGVVSGEKTPVDFGKLSAGTYDVKANFTAGYNYIGSENSTTVTVAADKSKITASNAQVTYSAGQYYKITVYGADGKVKKSEKVVVKINNKNFKTITTDANGIAKFKVTQTPGTYKVKATALGKTVQKTLTVKHIVTLKKVTVKRSAKKLVVQASLSKVSGKYLKGKQITFKFNGKTYKAKTDSKGVAKITVKSAELKKLKAGKTVTYQATYLKDTVSQKVKVQK